MESNQDSSEDELLDPQPPEQADVDGFAFDSDQAPRLPFPVVGIGGSAGGLEAITDFLSELRSDSGMAYVFVQHLPPAGESMLVEILSHRADIPVQHVDEGLAVEPNHLYVIRPGQTLTIGDGVFHLGERLAKPMHNRPIDDFFRSLAQEQRERGIAIIMSGMGSNGTAGAQAVKAVGGLVIAQDPETSNYPSMPRHLIDAGYADYILRPQDMPAVLVEYAGHPYSSGKREEKAALAKRDQQHIREILAVLRSRTQQDFSGYKRPTVLRRVQRRMGLNRVTRLGEYARLLRQTPSEVVALSDDLLIHVTGFFRDPLAWESLRERVIVPLVASRNNDDSIRCWVAGCSSGEEAYTLAILLIEEAEQAKKVLDIKVFATDSADRTLQTARNGVYPGGIESEIAAHRLQRFFTKEDAVYRVRPDLRERVIFAPQNLLQDPPFSRLDIATCRNLLIYVEPEMQRRILGLLHFGLREGGTLFLGTSETVGGDGLFEPIDKHAKIFRRVGPTRHGMSDFPPPRSLGGARISGEWATPPRTGVSRPSMTQMITRALIEYHTPAAVTIDRDGRIVYYHGNTEPFIALPRGEPTRELLQVARESVRGAVRAAVHRAISSNAPATVLDGWIETEPGRTVRIAVTASPLDPKNAPGHLVVSFQERGERPALEPESEELPGVDSNAELRRVREELQSTIEELQTSNEELKASHEEVVSTNEELQSTNEELETSREEMQSLNEELNTVNTQLRAKIEEHQTASNDLTSLLTSTDIAVLFLDTELRIRRFTPPMRELLDMINSDIGRPLADLNHKFTDADLDKDTIEVLERLAPVEREVVADNGHYYLRRILPYRTVDNRIDGVVITFVDISERKRATESMRDSEQRYRALVNASSYVVFRMGPDWSEMRYLDGQGIIADTQSPTTSWLEHYVPAEDQPRVLAVIREAVEKKGIFELEHQVRWIDGTVGWTFSRAVPLLDDQGQIIEWFGAATDITARRRAEEALQASEERLRRMMNIPGVGVLMFDRTGTLLDANDAFMKMTGYNHREITSKILTWRTLTPPDFVAITEQERVNLEENGRIGPYQKECLKKDGSRLWMLFAGASLGDGTAIEYCVDISDHKRAEFALRDSEERLRLIVEGAPDFAMVMLDAAGRITAWNTGAEQLLGYKENEVIGQDGVIIFTPEDRAAGVPEREIGQATTTGRAIDERWHLRKDQSRFWGSGVLTALMAEDGTVRGFVKIMRDTTGRKNAEDDLQTAKDSAEEANRFKDDFLATLSHELRTPLSAVLLWAKILSEGDGHRDPQLREGLNSIKLAAESQKELIDDLLDVSRITRGQLRMQMREMDLAPVVRDAVDAIAPTAQTKGVTLKADLSSNGGVVRADAVRLRQIIWNLLTNAVKFTPAKGAVQVALRDVDGAVDIQVKDTGRGISADFLPHVFERFRQADGSSTRTQGGIGLGLSIAKELVELHGGTITAESAGLARGATFTVRLPLVQVSPRHTSRPSEGSTGTGKTAISILAGRNVLLVEDDNPTRQAVATLLRGAGMVVIEADSTPAAMAAFGQSHPDVIISDIGLPGEDGYALMRQIRSQEKRSKQAPVPAMALTAFAREVDRKRAMDAGFQSHVAKPVEPEQMLAAVREVLEKQLGKS
jgi:two-component system, chemotaxis family, CheB/CheR fusion protein